MSIKSIDSLHVLYLYLFAIFGLVLFFDMNPVYAISPHCDIPSHTDQYSCEQSGIWFAAKQERCTHSWYITKQQCEAKANQWIVRSDDAHCLLYKGGGRGERNGDSQSNCKCDILHWCWPGDNKEWQEAYSDEYCSPNRNKKTQGECESEKKGAWLHAQYAGCSISARKSKENCERNGIWISGSVFCLKGICSKTFSFEGDQEYYETIGDARYCNTGACINRWLKESSRKAGEPAYCRKGICASKFSYRSPLLPPLKKETPPAPPPKKDKDSTTPPKPDMAQITLPVLLTKKDPVVTLAWSLGNGRTGAYVKYRISNYVNGTLVGCETEDYSETWESEGRSKGATNISSSIKKKWGATDCNAQYSGNITLDGSSGSSSDSRLGDKAVPTVKEYESSGPATRLPEPQPAASKIVGSLKVGDGWAETSIKRAASNRLQTALAVIGQPTTRSNAISKLTDSGALAIVRASKGVDFKMLTKEMALQIAGLVK